MINILKFNKIYEHDCLDFMVNVLKDYNNYFNLVFADPPLMYDDDYYYKISELKYLSWCEDWFLESWRLLKEDCYYVFVSSHIFHNKFEDIIKQKTKNYFSVRYSDSRNEYYNMLFICKKNREIIDEEKIAYWYNVDFTLSEKELFRKENINPTRLPAKLCERIIKTFTNENDVIYDIFAGSGIFCYSAEKLKRKFIGTEINT